MAKRAFATLLLALVAVFAVPVAANAYVPDDENVIVTGTIAPGGAVTVAIENTFVAGTPVTFQVTGEGTATLAIFKAATASITKTADSSGTASVAVTLPSNATGTYTVEFTGTGPDGPISGSVPLTVSASSGSGGGGGLPDTGAQVPMLALWVGGGALLLGAALVATMSIVRRQRESQES